MTYLGIDPGLSGGLAVVDSDGCPAAITKMPETERDILDWLLTAPPHISFAMIEFVSSSPQMGVTSAFTFGKGYGVLIGLLTACGIPFEFVRPLKWQTKLGCKTGGDKNVSKRKAQQLWPDQKITHATADALLIAEYCRQVRH